MPVEECDRVAEEVELAGRTIRPGQQVLTLLGAAGRDPEVFDRPDSFDITRTRTAEHLAFSGGRHYCLGAPLARLEGQIAIGTVLARLPELTLAIPPGELEWQVATLRGPKRLPVTFASG